ncbi:MAG TPA: hypothetical protein VN828_03555, partial [Acidobacteriaceae bacterium]|nr:hypothetical protein [Acidobacteriaceae bacterium]
ETLSGGSFTESMIGSGLVGPAALVVDSSGDVYISDLELSEVFEEVPSGGGYTQKRVPFGDLWSAQGVAVDSNRNVYLADASAGRVWESDASAANFGTVSVGSSSSAASLIFTFETAGSIATPAVLTLGAPNLDFSDAGTGSCTTWTSSVYQVGYNCTVDVVFSPKLAGVRYGAAVLQSSSGGVIAAGYVSGTGSGPQVNFTPGTESLLSLSNVVNPYAITEDAAGNLYVAEAVSAYSPQNAVVKETWTGSGYAQSIVASGLAYPVAVAVDGAGNVYIADQDAEEVIVETPLSAGGYGQSATFTNLGNVEAVAVDGRGNVYIGSLGYGLVKETLTAGGYEQSIIQRDIYPNGIALDGQGNIYLSLNGSQLFKETLSGGTYTESMIASGLGRTIGVAVDAMGNVYAADYGNNQIVKETVSGGGYIQSAVAVNLPGGVAVDGTGNVFASSVQTNIIWKLDVTDPPGLSFASAGVGATSNDSPKIVTLENVGNAALNFPIPGAGTNPSVTSGFALANGGSSGCPMLSGGSSTSGMLSAGGSCLLSVSFTPKGVGPFSGSLVLVDNNQNAVGPTYATQSIALSGTGVGAAAPIAWTTPAAISYGTPLSSTQLNASSTVAGTFAYSPAAGTVLNAGSQVLSVTFTPADSVDYSATTAITSIVVSPAAPGLSFAPTPTRVYGAAPFAVTATSRSSGAVTYAVVSGPATITGDMVTLTG